MPREIADDATHHSGNGQVAYGVVRLRVGIKMEPQQHEQAFAQTHNANGDLIRYRRINGAGQRENQASNNGNANAHQAYGSQVGINPPMVAAEHHAEKREGKAQRAVQDDLPHKAAPGIKLGIH